MIGEHLNHDALLILQLLTLLMGGIRGFQPICE